MLDLLWSVGGFLIAIGVLVSFHEFGHYWVARRCGVKVLRFSLGFGKQLWTRRDKNGCEWTVSALPLGGYVKMLDEREGDVAAHEKHLAFNNASVGKRLLIVAAGPAFNFMLAIIFYWVIFVLGVQGMKTLVAEPPAASAAAKAGLHEGDLILAVDGTKVTTWTTLRTELLDQALDAGMLPIRIRQKDGVERTAMLNLAGVRVDPEVLFADLGLDAFQPPIPPRLGEIVPGEAADTAGFKTGDLLLARDGEPIPSWQALRAWLIEHPGEVVQIEFERGGATQTLELIVGSNVETGKVQGRIGARPAVPQGDLWQNLRAEMRLNPIAAIPAAVKHTWQMSVLTLKMLYRMVAGDISIKNISGPITIAQVAGFSAQDGLVTFLSFMAIVSVSLGVLNLLPVPLLDGGHLLYYGIEAIKGSPVSERMQAAGQRFGMTFLVLLMGLAFYNDIMRLIN